MSGRRRVLVLMRWQAVAIGVAAVVLVVFGSTVGTAAPRHGGPRRVPAAPTIYSLVHSCEALTGSISRRPVAGADGPFRMQAAALGTYLLYTPRDQYLTDIGSGSLAEKPDPSPAAEWVVKGNARRGFAMSNLATTTPIPVRFIPARGCATYPEAQVDATGNSFAGSTPEASALGTVEGHAHITAFELFGGDWHCGAPWSPYGAPYALPASCARDEQGTNGAFQQLFDYGGGSPPSDLHGWPTFVGWPSPDRTRRGGRLLHGCRARVARGPSDLRH